MTAPYSAAVAGYIKGSLEHIYTVTADPKLGASFELPTEDAGLKVTLAEDWAPHIQTSLTVPMLTQEQLDALDPRTGARIQISAGYRYPDGTQDVHQLADLAVRLAEPAWPANQVGINASSDEALAQDRMRVEANIGPFAFAGINEAVQFFANYAVYPDTAVLSSSFAAGYGAASVAGLEVATGTPMWSPIEDVAARAGVWVHCTPDRKWSITPRPGLTTPAHVLTVGTDGTIITARAPLDRTQWANHVLTEYSWTDGAGAQQTVYGRAAVTSGRFSVNSAGYRTVKRTYTRPATQAQADAAAASRVRNLVSRGRGLTLEAHAAYWLRPGDTITVQLPLGPAENHVIKSITFDPPAGLMSIQTRLPLDATITTGE